MSRAWGRERGRCLLLRPWAPSWCHSTTSFTLTHRLQAWQSLGLTHSVKALHQALEIRLPREHPGQRWPPDPLLPITHRCSVFPTENLFSLLSLGPFLSLPSPLIRGRQEAPHRGLPTTHTHQPPRLEGSVSGSGAVTLPPANPSSGSPIPSVLMTL